MALAATVLKVENTQKTLKRTLSITFSGNYTTGGDTLDLTAVTVSTQGSMSAIKFHRLPFVYELGNPCAAGFGYELVPGTTLANWLLKVYRQDGSTGALAEIAQAAYPAAVLALTNFQVTLEEKAA